MTIRESIFAVLTTGSPALSVHAQVLPQEPVLPALVYTIVYREDFSDLAGVDCGLANVRVQVDAYAGTQLSADQQSELAAARLLAAADLSVVQIGGTYDQYEPDTRRFRAMREFSVWQNK